MKPRLVMILLVLGPASSVTQALFVRSRRKPNRRPVPKKTVSIRNGSSRSGALPSTKDFVHRQHTKSTPTYIYANKPQLRGEFHRVGALLYPLLLGLPLFLRASTTAHQRAALLFSVAVEGILVVSATLHTFPWLTDRHEPYFMAARKADFAMIFVGIALLYSSLGKILLGHLTVYRQVIEPLVWLCATLGVLLKICVPDAPPYVNALLFLVQGWAVGPLVPELFETATGAEATGLVAGGVFITLGATAYAVRWPDGHWKVLPPDVFGPHEMFHVGTLLMFLAFWWTMWQAIGK